MKATPEQQRVKWLQRAAGHLIDETKEALAALQDGDPRTLAALQAQLQRIEKGAARAGHAGLAAMALQARNAGTADVRGLTGTLLALLRGTIRSAQSRVRPDGAKTPADAVAGMVLCDGVGQCVLHRLDAEDMPPGVIVLHIEAIESIRRERGEAGAATATEFVAGVIRRQLREGDSFSHTGRNCFALHLPGQEAEGVARALKRIGTAVAAKPVRWPDGARSTLHVSVCGSWKGRDKRAGGTLRVPPQCRVCVVAGSAGVRQALAHLVRQAGCEAELAQDYDASLWTASKAGSPGLVVIDLPLAGLEQALTHHTANPRGRRVPVVAIVNDAAEREWALEHGARRALIRPVKPDDFRNVVGRIAGRRASRSGSLREGSPVLVASNDIAHLISIGTSLQKQAGCHVHLCRGGADAVARLGQIDPAAAVIDLPPDASAMRPLFAALADKDPAVPVVLIASSQDRNAVREAAAARIVDVLHKPVDLLQLAERVTLATGIKPAAATDASFEWLRAEIRRAMGLATTA